MRDDREQDLDSSEREILRSLASGSSERDPSGDLEDRIVGALKRRGLVASSRLSLWSWGRLGWGGAWARPSPWKRLAQVGALATALAAAFLIGTYHGKKQEQRAARVEPAPSSIPAPAMRPGEGEGEARRPGDGEAPQPGQREPRQPRGGQPRPSTHPGAMLTAFHMSQDHPLVTGPVDYGQDPLGISGKPLEP